MKGQLQKIIFTILLAAGAVAMISTKAQQSIVIQDATYSQQYSNDSPEMPFNLTPRVIYGYSDCGLGPSLSEPEINISYPLVTTSERIVIGGADLVFGNAVRVTPDVNRDEKVNIVDITIIGKAFDTKPGHVRWNAIADLDGNEWVNIVDVSVAAKEFGKPQIENFVIAP